MADAFAPQLGSEVRFNQPVETPSGLSALANLGSFFVGNLADSQRRQASAAPKTDPNLAAFKSGLDRVEAIRQERGETAAQVAERQLAANFAVAGINFDAAYEDVYTTTTGRPWAGYGMDVQATMLQDALKDPQVQANYIASLAVLGPDATNDQRIEYAIGQKATLQAAENEIAKSKTQANYQWSVQSEAAYATTIDTFLNTSLGALSANSQQGARVSPMDVQNMKAQWGQLKVILSRPSNISDDQWKSTQDKITNIDNLLTTFEKSASSDILLEEFTTSLATAMTQGGDGSVESMLAGMAAIKDPATVANLAGIDFSTYIMGIGKGDLNLKVTQQDLFGHVLEDQGSLTGVDDPNSFLSSIPETVKTSIDGKTPEQIFNGLDASGKLASLVKPADLNRPDAKEQFVTNAATIGAVLMNNPSEEFLSDAFLKQLIANPGFIRNVTALDAIDPEGATVARQYVRSGLNVERGRQATNFGTIETYLRDIGIVWDGSAYVLTPEAEAASAQDTSISGVSPLQIYGGVIKQAMDRRAAITTIDRALKALEVPTAQTEGSLTVSQSNTPAGGVGSVTAQLLDRFEGGGDYDALFGFANREGGPFSGTKVSEMTIGELKNFANGEYADYSREQLGYKATPMGRFQFVGSTLSSVAKRMGLSDDTVFTPQVQNDMFIFHAKEVMAGKSQAGKRAAMRDTWEGLSNASDAELDQMISEIEGGKASFGTTGVTGGTFRGARPTDANAVASRAGEAVQRATAPSAGTPSASMNMPSGGAPTASVAEAAAALPEAIRPSVPAGQVERQPVAIDADVQALIREIADSPDKVYTSSEEFLVAQQRGELEPGDTVIVDGDAYVIRKDGTARRIGTIAQ